MKRKLTIVILIVFNLLVLSGCGRDHYRNMKPNDTLSKTVREAVGKDMYYLEQEEENGVLCYEYLLRKDDKKVFEKFVEAINEGISGETDRVNVRLRSPLPGGSHYIMSFYNYAEDSHTVADYDGFKKIAAGYPNEAEYQVFRDLSIYTDMEDVRSFTVSEELQEAAEAQGIDWYEVWPDLEYFQVGW